MAKYLSQSEKQQDEEASRTMLKGKMRNILLEYGEDANVLCLTKMRDRW
jgi:hypothetical protein